MNSDIDNVPQHLAIIMDGNGRWAQKQGKLRTAGHKAAVETTRKVVENAARSGVKFLTLFAFSTENWQRPEEEVGVLMELFLVVLGREVAKLHDNDIRVCFVGNLDDFTPRLQKAMRDAEAKTLNNKTMLLNIAVSYGGRDDITQVVKTLAADVKAGTLEPQDIDESAIAKRLYTAHCPDVDLFVRTGGERRLSNFLMWNLAYSELYFCDVLWPDFDRQELQNALDWYATRQRRFGKTGEQLQN
jgi:undecaprenyl diphosphate synthase